MDKVRQLGKNEIQDLNMVRLARKCEDLFFIDLDDKSEYVLRPLEKCDLSMVYDLLKNKRPLIEIYGVRDDEEEGCTSSGSSDSKVLDSTASDKITIYCHNKQEFLDFTDWLLGVFREYGTILMADILDKIGFSDAQVDHDLEITESQVFMYDEKQKVVIYKND